MLMCTTGCFQAHLLAGIAQPVFYYVYPDGTKVQWCLTHLRVSGQIAKGMDPCLQVRVSQKLAELARRPPVPVKISGRQVTQGPALDRHLQGLIQQLSLTGEAEVLSYNHLIP